MDACVRRLWPPGYSTLSENPYKRSDLRRKFGRNSELDSGFFAVPTRDEHHNGTYRAGAEPIPYFMKAFSLVSLLIVVAIIGFAAKSYFQPAGSSTDPNDKSSLQYWVAHTGDRTAMISF